MATFSVDITSVVFAGTRTGHKDITITGMPAGGVTVSLTGSNPTYFTYTNNPESKGTNVYRVSTKSTHTASGGSDRTANLKITNKSDSTDYVTVSLKQYCTPASVVGYVKYVISNYSDIYGYSFGNSAYIYFPYSLSDSTAKVELYVDGSISSVTVPSWASYVNETTYTDTGFSRLLISCTNNHNEPRKGFIKFSTSFRGEIYQNGYPSSTSGCTQSISFTKSGGTESIVLNTSSSSTSLGNQYLSDFTSPTVNKIDNNNYSVTIGTNNTGSDLTGMVWFADAGNSYIGHTIITQSGAEAASLTISPTGASVGSAAGTTSVTVTSTGIDTVEYSIEEGWVSLKTQSSNVYTFSYTANTSSSKRSCIISFYGGGLSKSFVINQAAGAISVSPKSKNVGNTSGTVQVTVTGSSDITYTISSSWLTYQSKSGNVYTFAYAQNSTSSQRTTTVTFSASGMKDGTFTLTQAASAPASLTISPTSNTVISSSGSVQITVTSSGISDIQYSISDNWITYGGKSGNVYTFNYSSKASTGQRTGTIIFSGGGLSKTYTLTQEGISVDSITVNKNILSVANGGGYLRDFLTVTYTGKVTVVSSSWITGVSSFSSNGTYKYSFSVSGNTETESSTLRRGNIKFMGDNGTSCKVDVYQGGKTYGKRPVCMPDYTLGTYPAEGGQKYLVIDYYKELTYTGVPNWITLNIVAGGTGATDSIDDTSPVIFSVRALRNNSSSSRKGTMVFQGGDSLTLKTSNIAVSQEGKGESDPLSVSPTELNYTASGGTKSVTVSGGNGTINVNNGSFPSWLSVKSAGGGVYNLTATKNTGKARSFTVWFTDNTSTVTMNVYQQAGDTPGPGPGPTPVVTGSLKAYPMRLRYYSDGGSIAVSFTNRPRAGIGYTITYTDGTGWLSAEKSDPDVIVTASKNTGIRRRASIKFYDLGDSKNYVIVPVIQGSEDGYSSIWMDDLFYPAEGSWDGSGNYYYRIVDKDTNYEYFSGVAVNIFPGTVGEGLGGIDIPRLVEYYISTTLEEQKTDTGWGDMSMGYCTVDVYNMTTSGYPGTVEATFKYWNDWSRFEKKYDYTRTLNDPINSKGCDNMIIPFCVYYDESSVFSIVDTERNGNVNTKTLSTPSKPFMMRTDSYYDSARIDYKQDGQILFSYDMTHCGQGALIYRNRFGGWDSFLIEGNISKTDNYTKQNYRKKGGYNLDYSIDTLKYIDEKRTEGVDIDTTYQAYTGWLTDEESERLVFHLLSSPTVFFQNLNKANQLYDTDSEFGALLPVRITASSSEYKKFRNGKRLVNYLITFEKCNIEQVRR